MNDLRRVKRLKSVKAHDGKICPTFIYFRAEKRKTDNSISLRMPKSIFMVSLLLKSTIILSSVYTILCFINYYRVAILMEDFQGVTVL